MPGALNERLEVLGRHFPQAALQRALLALNRDGLLWFAVNAANQSVESSPVALVDAGPQIGVHDLLRTLLPEV
jgi:hypothetical protein